MIKKVHPILRILIVLMPLWLLWFYISQAGWYYMSGDYAKEMFIHSASHEAVDREYNVLILGDSMSNAAYLPELLSEDTLNLSVTGGTCIESYYILKNYIETHGAPETVFYSPRHEVYYDDTYIESHFYYQQFSLSEAIEITRVLHQCDDDPEMYAQYHPIEWFKSIFYVPSTYVPALINSGFFQRHKDNMSELNSLQVHRGNWLALRTVSTVVPEEETHLEEFKVLDFNDYYFDAFCKLCSENGITLHLRRTPYSSNFTFSEQFMKDYNDYFQSYADKYPGIDVDLDFSQVDDILMYDNGHVNLRGALYYSTMIKEKYPEAFDDTLPVSAGTIEALTRDYGLEQEEPYRSQWKEILTEKKARFERGE